MLLGWISIPTGTRGTATSVRVSPDGCPDSTRVPLGSITGAAADLIHGEWTGYGEGPATSVAGPSLFVPLNVGGDLLSHTLPGAVPSALEGLATGFGMGPGVPPPPQPPTTQTTYSHLTRPCCYRVWLCAQGHTVDANNRFVG